MQDSIDIDNPPTIIKRWVDLYSDKMFSWAFYKTSSKETAEDLVQDTFLAAVHSFNKFEGKSNPQTWLFAILKNKIVDHYRKAFKSPVFTESSQRILQEANNFFDCLFDRDGVWTKEQMPGNWDSMSNNLLDDRDFVQVLQLCIDKLPSRWNTVIQLKYLEEKKAKFICQELGITTTNYWQMQHRAKLQLRKCLELSWFIKQ